MPTEMEVTETIMGKTISQVRIKGKFLQEMNYI